MTLTKTIIPMLSTSMMTPAERAKGRFMRAPDGHDSGGKTFTKAELDAAIKDAIEKNEEPLRAKRDELLEEVKELKAAVRKASGVKPEDLAAVEDRADKAEARVKELEKAANAATKAQAAAEKALADEQGFTQKLLIQDGLKSALIAAGVKDEDYLELAVAKFSSGASIINEGDVRKAMFGDKPLNDHIKEWAATDAGKKIISAPVNSGGGSGGSKGNGSGGKSISQSDFDSLSPKDRAAKMAEGYTIAEANA